MRKPQIPSVPPVDPGLSPVLRAMKENLEILSGVRSGKIQSLSTSASTAEIISKINEIIDRLNA